MEDDFSIRNDPDYKEFYQNKNNPSTVQAEDSKHLAVFKIEDILQKQFSMEMEFKEEEIQKIEQRINQTKAMLDRLRAYVAAGYYGSGGLIVPGSKAIDNESKSKKSKQNTTTDVDPITTASLLKTLDTNVSKEPLEREKSEANIPEEPQNDSQDSRFYVSKKLIVGNVSKYLLADARKENDQSTHKWMVYVRTESGDDKEIDKYIKSVSFFLHPSYIPNDIVTVTKPPFQVTRRGWGEFPVRVQLHFRDARNKRFDVIHNLKLDKTYTGLQTLGAETIVDIELHKHANNETQVTTKSFENQPVESPTAEVDYKESSNSPQQIESTITNEDAELMKLTLPVIADLRCKLPTAECASVASSCVSSANPSRCNSPVGEVSFNNTVPLDSDIDGLLYKLLPNAPLISTNGLRNKYFTCPSLEVYQSWHFTKRRAIEWHRASFIRKLYLRNSDDTSRCPTTKEILMWLRHCGFTPPEKDLNVALMDTVCCNTCGRCLDKDQNQNVYCSTCIEQSIQLEPLVDSISPFTSVLSNVKLKEETLCCIEKAGLTREDSPSLEDDIDIINIDKKYSVPLKSKDLNVIPPTLAETWVTDLLEYLGISVKPYVMSNTTTPVVQAMLFAAMKSFMCHLLRRSNMEAKSGNKSSLEPALITFQHVHSAILKEPLFDFLTDAHLGKL